MIDIHSHVLFSVDDGPIQMEESINLIEKAISLGYTGIVCSSHYRLKVFENREYNIKLKELREEIVKRDLPINLYSGNELEIDNGVLEILNKVNTINNSRYILVEFPYGLMYNACKKILDEIIKKGYIPVLAHVERYPYIHLVDFITMYESGIVFQMNIRTVEQMTKKVNYLLKNGYIKIVATDTHRLGRRDYDIEKYLEILKKEVGEERYNELLIENPNKVITNENIEFKKIGGENENKKLCFFRALFNTVFTKFWGRTNSRRRN